MKFVNLRQAAPHRDLWSIVFVLFASPYVIHLSAQEPETVTLIVPALSVDAGYGVNLAPNLTLDAGYKTIHVGHPIKIKAGYVTYVAPPLIHGFDQEGMGEEDDQDERRDRRKRPGKFR